MSQKCCNNPHVRGDNDKYSCLNCHHKWDLSEKSSRIYKVGGCGCSKPHIRTTNDGNRHQGCLNCGWKWDAPDKNVVNTVM